MSRVFHGQALIDLLRNRARPCLEAHQKWGALGGVSACQRRPYLFSNTLAPSVATLLPSQRDLGLQAIGKLSDP